MFPAKAALVRCSAGCISQEIRKAREVFFALQHQRVGLLIRQYILAECGAERREAFRNLCEPCLRGGIECRTGALEGDVIALQHPRLLGREAEVIALLSKEIEPAEQSLIGV